MRQKLIKLEKTFNKSVLEKINDAMLDQYGIELWLKRDDLLHPVISGNKWRKLKYSLDHALSLDADTVISMGGAYSNHLHALAYTGKTVGLKTIGFIRGEQPETLTPALRDMKNWGMELRFVSRPDYRILRQYKEWFDLPGIKPGQYWLPEGGAQTLALKGVGELMSEIEVPYDIVCVSCGTGTTLAGIVDVAPAHISVIGFAALKNAGFLINDIHHLLSRNCNNWEVNLDYHFGGFAKTNADLVSFMEDFELRTSIPLEFVYTGKMMYALYDLIRKHYFRRGQRIIAIHTGGLQGRRGWKDCQNQN